MVADGAASLGIANLVGAVVECQIGWSTLLVRVAVKGVGGCRDCDKFGGSRQPLALLMRFEKEDTGGNG